MLLSPAFIGLLALIGGSASSPTGTTSTEVSNDPLNHHVPGGESACTFITSKCTTHVASGQPAFGKLWESGSCVAAATCRGVKGLFQTLADHGKVGDPRKEAALSASVWATMHGKCVGICHVKYADFKRWFISSLHAYNEEDRIGIHEQESIAWWESIASWTGHCSGHRCRDGSISQFEINDWLHHSWEFFCAIRLVRTATTDDADDEEDVECVEECEGSCHRESLRRRSSEPDVEKTKEWTEWDLQKKERELFGHLPLSVVREQLERRRFLGLDLVGEGLVDDDHESTLYARLAGRKRSAPYHLELDCDHMEEECKEARKKNKCGRRDTAGLNKHHQRASYNYCSSHVPGNKHGYRPLNRFSTFPFRFYILHHVTISFGQKVKGDL
ncbi:hypothetical protein IE53DRAFT_362042 [Violaceomyces palustris]|uniref:Uncharacterized protein n=1 Tax=Violaceomyces palustris TaxID=1673888 RepID=A0ACD0NYJ2_9BASI|nr:hypothetical protein IE53DRAFT_362042 [Violaceomyces palustris]